MVYWTTTVACPLQEHSPHTFGLSTTMGLPLPKEPLASSTLQVFARASTKTEGSLAMTGEMVLRKALTGIADEGPPARPRCSQQTVPLKLLKLRSGLKAHSAIPCLLPLSLQSSCKDMKVHACNGRRVNIHSAGKEQFMHGTASCTCSDNEHNMQQR